MSTDRLASIRPLPGFITVRRRSDLAAEPEGFGLLVRGNRLALLGMVALTGSRRDLVAAGAVHTARIGDDVRATTVPDGRPT